jgi:prefoldin subunit 5
MKKTVSCLVLGFLFLGSFALNAAQESLQSKLQAYDLAVRSRYELNQALPCVDEAIAQAKVKVSSYQAQVDDGVTFAAPMLDFFKKKLADLKKTRSEAQSKLDQLNGIIEALKKDPEVGPQITSSEALSQMKSKLQEASSLLPKTP